MAHDHCTSIEDENSGKIKVNCTSCLVVKVPPLVFHLMGSVFLLLRSASGTCLDLTSVLLHPVSISTRCNFTGSEPVTFFINAVTSVIRSADVVLSKTRIFLLRGVCMLHSCVCLTYKLLVFVLLRFFTVVRGEVAYDLLVSTCVARTFVSNRMVRTSSSSMCKTSIALSMSASESTSIASATWASCLLALSLTNGFLNGLFLFFGFARHSSHVCSW